MAGLEDENEQEEGTAAEPQPVNEDVRSDEVPEDETPDPDAEAEETE